MGSLDIALFLISAILFFGSTVLTKDDIMHTDMIISLVVSLPILAVAYIFVPKNKYKSAYILLVFLAGLIRMALVSYLYSNGTDTFGTDGLLYHQEGILVARQLDEGVPFYSVKYSYTWYTVLVGILYYIFGINRYIVSYMNVIVTFFSAILLLKMALNHHCKFVNAAFISLAFLYFPNLILWTSDSRKEALIMFLCFLCWYHVQLICIDIVERKRSVFNNLVSILLVCFLIWLGTLIRIYIFVPLAFGIILSQLLLYKKNRSRLCIVFAAIAFVSSIIIFFVTVNPLMSDYHAITFHEASSSSFMDTMNGRISTIGTIASDRNILLSVINYLLLPYPGNIHFGYVQSNNLLEVIVSLDITAWYICLFLMLPGIYSAIKQKESSLIGILAFLASYVIINALVVENVSDTIYRYRSVIIGLALLFIDFDVLKKMFYRLRGYLGSKADTAARRTVNSYKH